MNHLPSRCSGRSLVELLVAVSVAAVLTGAAVPSYSMLVTESRLTAVAGDFHNLLFLARSEAVKRGQAVQLESLSGTTSWAEGAHMFVDTDGDGVQDAGEQTLSLSAAIDGGYSFTGPAASIRFQPGGALSVSPTIVSFALCRAGASGQTGRAVTVSQTGRPAVSDSVCA